MGGANHLTGRVDICFNNEWGTVCNQMWDDTDAGVVCRQLGFRHGKFLYFIMLFPFLLFIIIYIGHNIDGQSLSQGTYVQGTGNIWLDNVQCSGSEKKLADCRASSVGINFCTHAQDAGVVCQEGKDKDI